MLILHGRVVECWSAIAAGVKPVNISGYDTAAAGRVEHSASPDLEMAVPYDVTRPDVERSWSRGRKAMPGLFVCCTATSPGCDTSSSTSSSLDNKVTVDPRTGTERLGRVETVTAGWPGGGATVFADFLCQVESA